MDPSKQTTEGLSGRIFETGEAKRDFLLGNLQIPSNRLSAADWAAIISEILAYICSHLKYLSGFQEVKELLSFPQHDHDERWTDQEIVELPEDFTLDTRVINVSDLCRKDIYRECEGDLGGGHGVQFIITKAILMNKKGRLLLWEAKYERHVVSGLGYRAHRTGIKEVAVYSRFSWFPLEKLEDIFTENNKAGEQMARALMGYITQTINAGRERLQLWENINSGISEIMCRIDFSPY